MTKRRRFALEVQPKKPILDMVNVSEDERCLLIGRMAMERQIVAFMVDDEVTDGEHKADRYMRKIIAAFPLLVELERMDGPVANVITLRIGLPETEN